MCKKIVLAIDQATNTSAYAVNKGGKILDYGKFEAGKSSEKPHPKIRRLQKKIERLVKKHNPDIIYLEDVFKKGSVVGFKTMAGCLYVCIDTCIRLKVPYKVIAAGTWRNGIISATKRVEQKKEAITKAKELLGIATRSDDIAEACLISMYDNKE